MKLSPIIILGVERSSTNLLRAILLFQKNDKPSVIAFKETRYLHIIENMLIKCGEVKLIGIIRNPLAVLLHGYLRQESSNRTGILTANGAVQRERIEIDQKSFTASINGRKPPLCL